MNKKTCAYHCNKNGACINGQCLCIQDTYYSSDSNVTCLDTSILTPPTGTIGGIALATLASSGSQSSLSLTPISQQNTINLQSNQKKVFPFQGNAVYKHANIPAALKITDIKDIEPL